MVLPFIATAIFITFLASKTTVFEDFISNVASGISSEGSDIESSLNGEETWLTGVIQHKEFSPGQSSSGFGVGIPMSKNSSWTPVVGGGSTSDKYIVFINDEPTEIKKELWLKVEKEDNVRYQKGPFGKIEMLEVIDESKDKEESNNEESNDDN